MDTFNDDFDKLYGERADEARELSLRLETLLSDGERSPIAAETARAIEGYLLLLRLEAANDRTIQTLTGLDRVPTGFSMTEDWLTPTHEADLSTENEKRVTIVFPDTQDSIVFDGQGRVFLQHNGNLHECIGIRVQTNVVDPQRRASDLGLCLPVGGGTRVNYDNSQPRVGYLMIADADSRLPKMRDEAGALAQAMIAKNVGLDFPRHLIAVLGQMQARGDIDQGRYDQLCEQARKYAPGGGAKADFVVAVPEDCPAEDKLKLTAQTLYAAGYIWGLNGDIGPAVDRMAGDMNTTGQWQGKPLVEFILDGYESALNQLGLASLENLAAARAVVTGKREERGGLKARTDATGYGAWESLRALAEINHVELKGKTAFFRGCGSAATRAIIEASRAGMRLIIADLGGIIVAENGLSEDQARALFVWSAQDKRNICDWVISLNDPDISVINRTEGRTVDELAKNSLSDTNNLWGQQCPDVIVEAANSLKITEANAHLIKSGTILVEAANCPVTPKANAMLARNGVICGTGVSDNAGGVFASWFEAAQAILGVEFQPELIEAEIAALMAQNKAATYELIEQCRHLGIQGVDFERAYYAMAIAMGLQQRIEVSNSPALATN